MRIARRLLLWLSLLPALVYADSSRVINGKGLEDMDTAALNVNFDQIDNELANVVHKTSTETIRGFKYFSNTVSVSTISATYSLTGAVLLAPYPYMQVRDHQTQNTADGTFTSGSWQTRTLNTVTTNTINGASLSSNKVTLPTGTYYASFYAPAFMVDRHQVRISSVTGAAVQILGQNAYADAANVAQTVAQGEGVFSVPASSSTQIELQHRCSTTRAANGFGVEVNVSTEVYAVLNIWQIKQ